MPWHLESNNSKCSGWAVVKDSDGSISGCHKTKAQAQAHLAALYINVPDAKGVSMAEHKVPDDAEVRVVGFTDMEIRHSGRPTEGFTIRGYPAIYDQPSDDLGGFYEVLEPGAFDEVLATNPDVHFVWDHDTRYVGARTTNGTLKLTSDDKGLFMEAQVGNYSWAKDLRVALERKDIDQGSFKFGLAEGGAEMSIDDNDKVRQSVHTVDALYDVTVTARGAYPQTSLAVVRSLAAVTGRPLEEVEAALVAAEQGQGEERESAEPDEEFEMWRKAMTKKAEARRATLVKMQERMDKLHGRQKP